MLIVVGRRSFISIVRHLSTECRVGTLQVEKTHTFGQIRVMYVAALDIYGDSD